MTERGDYSLWQRLRGPVIRRRRVLDWALIIGLLVFIPVVFVGTILEGHFSISPVVVFLYLVSDLRMGWTEIKDQE